MAVKVVVEAARTKKYGDRKLKDRSIFNIISIKFKERNKKN